MSFSELSEDEITGNDGDFVSVRISEFYSPRTVAFDLHLRLGAGRYLRVFRSGEPYDEMKLKGYEADHGVRQVFFAASERFAYVKTSLTLLQRIAPLAAVPLRAKFGVSRILCELFVQELMSCSDDKRRIMLVEQGKAISLVLAGWIEAESGLEAHLAQLEQVEPTEASLAFITAIYSCVLSKCFPWKSRRTSETLLLASMLCDLGQSALPPEITRLRPKRMNSAQKKIFEMHPELSYELLKSAGTLHDNILTIVRCHHEYFDGSGFPNKLTGEKTLLLAKVICLCGDLARCSADFLLPPGEAVKVLFPIPTAQAFTATPEVVAKYDRDLLVGFFKIFAKPKGKELLEDEAS